MPAPKLSRYQNRVAGRLRRGSYLEELIGGFYFPGNYRKVQDRTVDHLIDKEVLIRVRVPAGETLKSIGIDYRHRCYHASEFAIG